jgi:hypothetical protein
MIVVTGAGSHVGGLIASALARRGVPFRARLTGEQPLSIGEVMALHGDEIPLASR